MGDSTVPEMTAPMSKKDPDREGSTESSSSTPEAADQEAYNTQENPQQQKRKGGRKPVCSYLSRLLSPPPSRR